ncbi:Zn-dependent hydrolase [Lysinibacillus pakistanensis]|uniref:Zn-dependent hydrolase n=1 Tax=Lysinibacillus pakistanensis TaxID=759811 RepID=A0ABX6D7E0_9BACI|nr:Zn-dependent hydrolase [Lysinibacillus pakistanensis]
MKKIQLNSPEFNRVLKNLQFENLSLTPRLQKKVLEIVNSGKQISPTIIKEALNVAIKLKSSFIKKQ